MTVAMIHLSVFRWIGIAVFIPILLLASLGIRSIWNGESGTEFSVRWVRGMPTLFVVAWAMVVGAPLTILNISQKPGEANPVLGFLLIVVLVFIFVGMVVGAAAALTGHPEGVVPPYLRKTGTRGG